MLSFFGSSDIKLFVQRYFEKRGDLKGKIVVDIPAGKGVISGVLKDLGAEVRAYDLFPEFFAVDGLTCEDADLSKKLPIADSSVDIVLCQEGLEHLPDQLFALQEFNRILKPGGQLVVTVPNISHLRGKLSNFLTESEFYKRMPSNELDALWFTGEGNKMYFGHIFLLGIQKLRVLAIASGFAIARIHKVKVSSTSLLLGIFYPLIVLVNYYAYFKNVKAKDGLDIDDKRRVYREIIKLNMHPTILFGRHLFVEFNKVTQFDAVQMHVNKGEERRI